MLLYHVSFDRVKRFAPRVPQNISPGEDTTTPRICLSDSVIRCINARARQAWPIYNAMQAGVPIGFYVYEFQTDEFPPNALLYPEDIRKRGVIDATFWHEYWLLKPPRAVSETFFVVREATYQEDCAPSKWASSLSLEPSTDPTVHLAERFARQASKKLNESISTDIIYTEFAEELRPLWEMSKQHG